MERTKRLVDEVTMGGGGIPVMPLCARMPCVVSGQKASEAGGTGGQRIPCQLTTAFDAKC